MSGNTPLRFLGVGNLLDREYRNSPAYQWGRELARNGIEADAKVIRFGVEWEGVKATGTYRMQYADDGHGMTKDQLREYMLTLGKGGKIVGGAHDNYALGSRMTLLPWNPNGVVVISMVDGISYMVKMMFDPDAANGEGEYVLEEVNWEGDGDEGLATVYPPYVDDVLGFDWADTVPDFIGKAGHGTTFILLGRNDADNTINGDSERGERHRFLGRKYFNTRFWDIPEGITLQVMEMPAEPAAWPKSPAESNKFQFRRVRGGKSLVEYTTRTGDEFIASKGQIDLAEGTQVQWWLRTVPKVDTGGLGATSGYIGVLYRGELYGQAHADQEDGDTRIGAAVYRQFGIGSDTVRRRVFLIIKPPEYDEATGAAGVAPSTGRADLYWMGAGQSPRSVKPADWSEEFGEKLPKEILDAINAEYDARDHGDDQEERLKRVMDRFSKRWRATRARTQTENTDTTTMPTSPGSVPRAPIDSPTPRPRNPRQRKKVVVRGRAGEISIGQPETGDTPAKTTTVSAGVPAVRWVRTTDINDQGMIAAWQKPTAQFPNGCIDLDEDHPVIRLQIEYWQDQYPRAVAAQVEKIVREAYEEVAVAKVSHMHALAGTVLSEEQRDAMLLNPALTTALLGLISEDAVIGPRTGKLGTKRRRAEDTYNGNPETARTAPAAEAAPA
ncbi:hypothetical protein ACTFTM_30075 [Micromonospora sp. RB23]